MVNQPKVGDLLFNTDWKEFGEATFVQVRKFSHTKPITFVSVMVEKGKGIECHRVWYFSDCVIVKDTPENRLATRLKYG